MKKITGSISTNKVGSESEFEFEVDDDCTAEDIEAMARDAAFDKVEWYYLIDGQQPP